MDVDDFSAIAARVIHDHQRNVRDHEELKDDSQLDVHLVK
jgi:hypothetical protein